MFSSISNMSLWAAAAMLLAGPLSNAYHVGNQGLYARDIDFEVEARDVYDRVYRRSPHHSSAENTLFRRVEDSGYDCYMTSKVGLDCSQATCREFGAHCAVDPSTRRCGQHVNGVKKNWAKSNQASACYNCECNR